VCAGLEGRVIEIGFGTGLNVPHYPDAVQSVAGVEPSPRSVKIARGRLAASRVPVEIVGLDGQRLEQPDATFDHALCTWTLCTIPDPHAALLEISRVLKDGGMLHFVEHGLATDADVARRQERYEPLNQRLAGGCHLTRDASSLIAAAGFEITDLETGYVAGSPRPWGFEHLGRARKPRAAS
jgi:ubiquinone/menaquinone biosynthesis C-methylase UbiE